MVKSGILAAVAIIGLAATAQAGEVKHGNDAKEVNVPFANRNITDFRADGRDAVYLQVNGFDWYHAQLMGPCTDLPFAERIGIETRGTDTLDRYATLIVRGQRCQLSSLVKGAPPKKTKKR
ncbi:DUF6491 family protein [Sphingomonas lycopersici]|uniref:DUF6491 family protein n=1 Tax=Sphingomonas lycopersici TaxID=2951807 RepID=UPI002238D70C|nr:DUF6491 family protein [Sphingomonas lycopersici]